jgi:hypothetical protein
MKLGADDINDYVRRRLINAGFKGIIPASKASQIISTVLKSLDMNLSAYNIVVEPAPIHVLGAAKMCDCNRSIIRVKLLKTSR